MPDFNEYIQADVDVVPNPEEVQRHKYVSASELRRMMDAESGLQWSPWFRIIVAEFLDRWWKDFFSPCGDQKVSQCAKIHSFGKVSN